MPLTKKEYIEIHGEKLLAQKLRENDWPEDCEIRLVTGKPSINYKSTLAQELKGTTGQYEVGHKASRSCGPKAHVIAVRVS